MRILRFVRTRDVIHHHAVVGGIYLAAQFSHRPAVDRDAARENDFLTGTARRHACLRQKFLQTNIQSRNSERAAEIESEVTAALRNGLGVRFGLAQTGDAVALFPLAAFLEETDAFKAF